MNLTNLVAALSGPGAMLLAALAAAALTIVILRWPAAVGYIAGRLSERSSQGAMIFASNAVYGLISGALDWRPAAYMLMQSAYHVLLPDPYRSNLPPLPVTSPSPAPTADTSSLAVGAAKVAGALLLMLFLGSTLSACATADALQRTVDTGKVQPLDPVLVQQDLAVTKKGIDTLDCVVATTAPVASAIGSAVGNQDVTDAANNAASISKPLCPPGTTPAPPASSAPQ